MKPEILYEDDAIIAVNKPAGMLAIPDRFHPEKPNLQAILTQLYGKIFTIHRLDKETSGIILFAKDKEAHALLNEQFSERQVSKYYLALVTGSHLPQSGNIIGDLAPDKNNPGRMKVTKKGKRSVTEFQVLEQFKMASLVEIKILTGRQHQIRVHFYSKGWPLLIDKVYGGRESLSITDIKSQRKMSITDIDQRPLMNRTSLHAWKLEVIHPLSKTPLSFEAPVPKDFRAVLNQLRKWNHLN
jgi:23S rRNA pseudouridine955/2504/2580 synthase/23S rRNA pseudouridine1911/1915/1917 synthase